MDKQIKHRTELKVLSLEDSSHDFEILSELLINAGFDLTISRVETKNDYVSSLHNNYWDIILADFKLPHFDAFGALEQRQKICPEIPFICVSGSIGEERAVELLKLGATDYVNKDRLSRLSFAVLQALEGVKIQKERKLAEEAIKEMNQFNLQIINSAQEGIIVYDHNLIYQVWNPYMENLTGITVSEVLGKHPFRANA